MADKFGSSKCLVGSFVDCRDLTFNHWDTVKKQLDDTFEKLSGCKGAIFAVGNHMPANIPDEMMDKFFEALLPRLKR